MSEFTFKVIEFVLFMTIIVVLSMLIRLENGWIVPLVFGGGYLFGSVVMMFETMLGFFPRRDE
jgi:hypothetical protein